MGAALAWFATVVMAFGGIFLLYHLGVDIPTVVRSVLTGIDHALRSPLLLG